MGPTVHRNAFDVPSRVESAAGEHAGELAANVALDGREGSGEHLAASDSTLLAQRQPLIGRELDRFRDFNPALLSICCLFLFLTDDFAASEIAFSEEIPSEMSAESLRLASAEEKAINPTCEEIGKEIGSSLNRAEYTSLAILFRICESTTKRGGDYSLHYFGALPYQGIIPKEKYRFAFYTRLSDFPISMSDGMMSAEDTYLKIVITLNMNPLFSKHDTAPKKVATIDCDGSWRTCFRKPADIRSIFHGTDNEFTLAQNDECEAIVMNDLRLDPRIAEKRN